jgi:phosphotransferase system enzyme I (PtsP)
MPSSDRAAVLPLEVHAPRAAASLLGAVDAGELAGDLDVALDGLCRATAELFAADVATIYGRERDPEGDALVVLGNVGFPREVVGTLRLRVGDGLVGWVAECLRPISVVAADRDPRYRAIRGIGEETWPVMLAVPIRRRGRAVGVLVVQRAAAAGGFDARDVRIAEVHAEIAGVLLEAGARRGPRVVDADGAGAAVALSGEAIAPGFGLGRVEALPTAEAIARGEVAPLGARQVEAALARLARDAARLAAELGDAPDVTRACAGLGLMLADRRFAAEAIAAAGQGGGLGELARAYARAPYRTGGAPDPDAIERARDVEELCVLIHLTATSGRLHRDGQIWIASRIGACFAMAAAGHAAAIAIDGDGEITEAAAAIARAAGIPLIGGVRGLFAWTRPGDLAMVDADRGLVRINPASTGVIEAKAVRRAAR